MESAPNRFWVCLSLRYIHGPRRNRRHSLILFLFFQPVRVLGDFICIHELRNQNSLFRNLVFILFSYGFGNYLSIINITCMRSFIGVEQKESLHIFVEGRIGPRDFSPQGIQEGICMSQIAVMQVKICVYSAILSRMIIPQMLPQFIPGFLTFFAEVPNWEEGLAGNYCTMHQYLVHRTRHIIPRV